VIAGAAIGRDLAYYGADVLNIWRSYDTEIEAFAWDVQVGMRSTLLDGSKEDRAKFDRLLKDADVFFSNRRPGYLERAASHSGRPCVVSASMCAATRVRPGGMPIFS